MIEMFESFINDEEAFDMFITGRAGTGKTTDLAGLVKYCIENKIPCVVSAYTHKACDVLVSKLPKNTPIVTLDSFLCKRPTIDSDALDHKRLQKSTKVGSAAETRILFVDEYSMISEGDVALMRSEQDPTYSGKPRMKVVWLGDPYQLPPVGAKPGVEPNGQYQVLLTEIKRRAEDNPLGEPIDKLVSFIEGEEPEPLGENANFLRNQDIVEAYKAHEDSVILAFTNLRVQELNAQIAGRTCPESDDLLFSPTTQKTYTFMGWVEKPEIVSLPFGEPLVLGTKYRTLEYLLEMDGIKFAELTTEEGDTVVMAVNFGHYEHKIRVERLKQDAADSNKAIDKKFPGYKPAAWAKVHNTHSLARKRAKAWREFLTYDECVICIDFAHAMTVHKSQGSTFEVVCVDSQDIYKAASFSFLNYLKLMYVALSRASKKVITN